MTWPARSAGLVALALYAFSPDVIAHGSLATLDVPAAGFLLTSVWLLWRARRRPCRYLPLAGLAFGAALATKMSALAAVPVLLLLAVLSVRHAAARASTTRQGPASRARRGGGGRRRAGRGRRGVGHLPRRGSAAALGDAAGPAGRPRPARARRRLAAVPASRTGTGCASSSASRTRSWGGFLFGRHYRGSLWYYLPAALLVKTPLGALALWLAGAVVMVAVPRLRPAAPYVLVPAAVLLAAAMTGARDFGVRYAIFVPMFLAVAAAGVVAVRRRWAHVATAALVAVRRGQLAADVPVLPAVLQRGVRRAVEDPPAPARLERRLGPGPGPAGRPPAAALPGREDLARLQGQRRAVRTTASTRPTRSPCRPDQVRGLLVVSDSADRQGRRPAGGADRQQHADRRGRPLDHDLPPPLARDRARGRQWRSLKRSVQLAFCAQNCTERHSMSA